MFVDDAADVALPASITVEVAAKDATETGTIFTLEPQLDNPTLRGQVIFTTTKTNVEAGVAIHKYGAVILPANAAAQTLTLTIDGTTYTSGTTLASTAKPGDTLTFAKG